MNREELRDALIRYHKHFGETYGIFYGENKTDEEIIDEINNCIKTNTLQKEPDYKEDSIY